MNRFWFALLWVAVVGGPVLAQRATQLPARSDQRPTRPDQLSGRPNQGSGGSTAVNIDGTGGAAYPYPYTYSSTPAEGALNGASNVISSKGNYNLSTSEAAINMTQVQKNEMENHQQYENTYFQMRQSNDAARQKEAGPRPTEEQLVRLARETAPQAVSSSEVNPASGKINWPDVLLEDNFSAGRAALEGFSEKKAAHGSLGIADQMAARKTLEYMFAGLKSQIREVPPQDYVASREFLQSMIYALAHSPLE